MIRMRFEWDAKKDLENQDKHGVSFGLAQFAFADPNRVIAEDLSHSSDERRYYCFGLVDDGVLTVRFVVRGSRRCDPHFRGRLLAKRKENP